MLVFSFVSFNQVIEIEFNSHFSFKSDVSSTEYFTVMDNSKVEQSIIRVGNNKYIIDIDKKIVHLYFEGLFFNSKPIKEVIIKKDIIIVTMEDIDNNSGNPMLVYLGINKNTEKNDYPYFVFYFESAGSISGYSVNDIVK